jgi:two-component system chemotaxis response regulator CheB
MRDDRFRAELLARIKGLARLRRTITGAATPVPRTAAPTIPLATTPLATTPLATTPLATPLAIRSGRARPPIARPAPLLLAVGCSTGGPRALLTLIRHLGPAPLPVPVVITQHLPPMFTALLAEQLAGVGGPPCAEARDGDVLLPGHAWLAPGGHHLLIESGADGCLRARLSTAPPENHCRPSADPMLRSASAACGGRVLVVMLTGMGQDGLAGTRAVVAAGGTAIAQDEATSVVWGMPGAIARAGLCDQVLPLPGIADRVRHLLRPAGP